MHDHTTTISLGAFSILNTIHYLLYPICGATMLTYPFAAAASQLVVYLLRFYRTQMSDSFYVSLTMFK